MELIVALSLSAVVLATGYELFKALRAVSDRQNQSMAELWKMMNALDQVREDLIHAVPKSYGKEAVFTGGNAVPEFKEFKLLKFYSLCVSDHLNEVCGVRQIHRIEYMLVKEKDSLYLYRIATPIIGKAELTNYEDRKSLFGKIEEVKISFHNGHRLAPSFSSKEQLPVYVELQLTAYGQTWMLAVRLPCGLANMEQAL